MVDGIDFVGSHTGLSLVRYVNRLRINLACQMLMGEEAMKVTDICYASGFNNLSNFNRQFAAQKGVPPSRFRSQVLGRTADEDGRRRRAA